MWLASAVRDAEAVGACGRTSYSTCIRSRNSWSVFDSAMTHLPIAPLPNRVIGYASGHGFSTAQAVRKAARNSPMALDVEVQPRCGGLFVYLC
jgi:hypothetical protein